MKWENSALDALSCWSNAHGPLILLNVGEGRRCSHEYGRRFTLGHEICHLLTDRAHALGLVEVLGGGMPNFVERRANAFAAELLLPRQLAASELRQSNDKMEYFFFIYVINIRCHVKLQLLKFLIRHIILYWIMMKRIFFIRRFFPGRQKIFYHEIEGVTFEKVKREAAAQCRPAKSKRKNRAFSAKRQAVWFGMRSISN